jgi:undecaprenyl-diphosphatase
VDAVVAGAVAPHVAALSYRDACLLGAVQGLTEFLPVSSDGHLAILQYFLTPLPAEQKLAVTVALHLGTLVAVLVYFRRDLIEMVRQVLDSSRYGYLRSWAWLIVAGTIPAGVFGLTLKSWVEAALDSLLVIGLCFLFTGVLLYVASAAREAELGEEDVGLWDALVIGVFQALALLPGVSRSGMTISSGVLRHFRPEVATRFSFLLGIPAIAGALVLEGKDMAGLAPEIRLPLALGIVVAFVTGLAAIALLLRVVRTGKLQYFAYYCWALGVLIAAASLIGVA